MTLPLIPAGETGQAPVVASGAEGATAPETLRQQDRVGAGTLESDGATLRAVHRRG